nr:MAG TPA: hypothetical protein [Caudoviricetes sp.]
MLVKYRALTLTVGALIFFAIIANKRLTLTRISYIM